MMLTPGTALIPNSMNIVISCLTCKHSYQWYGTRISGMELLLVVWNSYQWYGTRTIPMGYMFIFRSWYTRS